MTNTQMMPQGQPQPIDAAMPLTVTLEAQQWNMVLGALNEAPYRVAAPLIQRIGQQLQEQTGQLGPGGMPMPNGADIARQ